MQKKKYDNEEVLKIGVQLFKIRSKQKQHLHLMDFKLAEGEVFTFFDEYLKIQKEIKSLNQL